MILEMLKASSGHWKGKNIKLEAYVKILARIHGCSCVFLVVLDLNTGTVRHFSHAFQRHGVPPNWVSAFLQRKTLTILGSRVLACSREFFSTAESVVTPNQMFLKLSKAQMFFK